MSLNDSVSLQKCKQNLHLPPSLLAKELIEPISKAANKARTLKQSVLKKLASEDSCLSKLEELSSMSKVIQDKLLMA